MSDVFARDRATIVAKLREQLDHHAAAVVQGRALNNAPTVRYHEAEATRLRGKIAELQKMEESHDDAG